MTMTVTLIREGVSLNITLEQLIDSLNKTLCQRNPNLMFVTLFIGILDKQTGMLEYANAGHCQPMMVNRQGAVRALTELSGPAVGVDEDLVYTSYHDQLAEDETLVLYTDGVTEAQNIHQELYGDDRLYAFLSAHANLSSADLSAKLTEELTNFKGTAPQFDDITMLIVSHR